jgi:SAM-dependent methyltransferase
MAWFRNIALYWLGIAAFAYIKVRNTLRGYRNPRPLYSRDAEKAYEYDRGVVENMLRRMGVYLGRTPSVRGRTVLELGPGADLGTGIILLIKGAKRYLSVDANDLAGSATEEFYKKFMDLAKKDYVAPPDMDSYVIGNISGNNRLRYIVNKDFDMSVLDGEEVDLVISQAAVEHFDDFNKTVSQLSSAVKSGAVFIAEVDLMTHSRWLRDADPLNIYRYNDIIYGMFRVPGSPSRLRPQEYRAIMEKHGWSRVEIYPLATLNERSLQLARRGLNKRFRDTANEMERLVIIICATKT